MLNFLYMIFYTLDIFFIFLSHKFIYIFYNKNVHMVKLVMAYYQDILHIIYHQILFFFFVIISINANNFIIMFSFHIFRLMSLLYYILLFLYFINVFIFIFYVYFHFIFSFLKYLRYYSIFIMFLIFSINYFTLFISS